MSTEFEKQIKAATGKVPTEKDKLVTIALDILRGLGYSSFQGMAASKIRQIPDAQIHEFIVHIREVLA
jgi:hypothetical protein